MDEVTHLGSGGVSSLGQKNTSLKLVSASFHLHVDVDVDEEANQMHKMCWLLEKDLSVCREKYEKFVKFPFCFKVFVSIFETELLSLPFIVLWYFSNFYRIYYIF